MSYNSLSEQELQTVFKDLEAPGSVGQQAAEDLQGAVHALQVYRMELESQNQALRQSQEELESSTRRYADLYDYSPIGYVTFGLGGMIEEANLTAAEMLRCDRERLIGRPFRRFLEKDDEIRFYSHLQDALAGRTAVLDVLLHSEELSAPLQVQLSSRVAPGCASKLRTVRTAITDVSVLKRAQHELQEINREQESFCYSISHDLRTPLVTISNFSSLLLREFGKGLGDEARGCAERIHRSATRMDQLLADLLNYAHMSRASLSTSALSLESVVDDVLQQHQGSIDGTGAVIEVVRPLGWVNGSPEALGQVVANLVSNALKFTPPGKNPRIRISSFETPNRTVLLVSDEGIGIAEESCQRIFGMFERLHGPTQYAGTGVGLAIVRRAVERMGGRIWVDSLLGEGSKFFVELPRP